MKVQKFVAVSMRKIYRIRLVRLEETHPKSLENINYLLISLVLILLVLCFAGTYFHDDKITIYYHILRMFTIADFPMPDFPSQILKTAYKSYQICPRP